MKPGILLVLWLAAAPVWASKPTTYRGCVERIASAHSLSPERLSEALRADAPTAICLKNVPVRFKSHPDFHRLAYDPDRKLISPQTIREAMAALESVNLGLFRGPMTRAPAGSSADFFDAAGVPLDIKCYSSPRTPEGQKLDSDLLTGWIIEKLNRSPAMQVVLDRTYLEDDDYALLHNTLRARLNAEQAARITEIKLPEPIRRLRH